MAAACSEKAALLGAYQKATKRYSHAVDKLQRVRFILADYDTQYRIVKALRLDATKALKDLENHAAVHDC